MLRYDMTKAKENKFFLIYCYHSLLFVMFFNLKSLYYTALFIKSNDDIVMHMQFW